MKRKIVTIKAGLRVHSVNSKPKRPQLASWHGVKANLAAMDKDSIVDLIHALYDSDPEIQQGLLMRFVPAAMALTRLRRRVVNLVYPDPLGTLTFEAGAAFKLIRKLYKISGDPQATCELLLDGIEAGTAQAGDIGVEDDSYFIALGQMMKMLVSLQEKLPQRVRTRVLARFSKIHETGNDLAYGLGFDLTDTLTALRRRDGRQRSVPLFGHTE